MKKRLHSAAVYLGVPQCTSVCLIVPHCTGILVADFLVSKLCPHTGSRIWEECPVMGYIAALGSLACPSRLTQEIPLGEGRGGGGKVAFV